MMYKYGPVLLKIYVLLLLFFTKSTNMGFRAVNFRVNQLKNGGKIMIKFTGKTLENCKYNLM